MALRVKILLVTSGVVLCLLAIYYLGLRVLVVNQLAALDTEEGLRDLLRVYSAGQAEENFLEAMCHRLALNDAMYGFAQDRDPVQVERLLTEDLFRIADLDLIFVCDTSGKVLWQRTYDALRTGTLQIKEFPLEGLPSDHPLLIPPNEPTASRDGFFLSSVGPIQVATKPILTSAGEGPVLGTVIVGRVADEARLDQIRKQTQASFSLHPLPVEGDRLWTAWQHFLAHKEPYVSPESADEMMAVGVATDVDLNPIMLVEVHTPRRIALAAQRVMESSIVATAATGVAIILAILIFLHFVVVSPVRQLTAHMQRIGHATDLSSPFSPRYSGEIGRLAAAFNMMIEKMGDAQRSLVDANARLRQEVEERERAAENLRDSEVRLSSLAESTVDGIISANSKGQVISWNRGAERLFGYTGEEVLGKSLTMLMPPEYRDKHNAGMARHDVGLGGQHIGKALELHGLHRDGTVFPLELTLGSWETREGKFFSAILRDIRRRKQAEEALAAAKDAAESANRAKSQFLASMSHEIRTPMNGVIGMTELLANTSLAPQQQRFVEAIRESADTLLEVINDILDLSKIEAGRVELEHTAFNVADLVQQIVWSLGPSARKKGLDLRCEIQDGAARPFRGDPIRLRQVLVNLVGNAIKFTERGECVVSVCMLERGDPATLLQFAVRDTGIGVPGDLHDVIFERFAQADASITRKYGGTGLGLTICKRLVELMEGRIWLESSPGSGSTFFFELPMPPAAESEVSGSMFEMIAEDIALDGLHVLVAEDTKMNQDLFELFLESQGHTVAIVQNGQEVVDRLRTERFDVVLMDVEMPTMDGVQATRLIRDPASGALDPSVPVIAVTAHALIGDRERFLEAGMNEYVSKPVDFRDLRSALSRAVAGRERTHPNAKEPGTMAILNRREALARLGGLREALQRMDTLFKEDGPQMRDRLEAAIAARNLEDARRAAHSLKSMAATVGAEALSGVAQHAEHAARNEDWDALTALAPQVREGLDAVLAAMREESVS